MQYIIRDLLFFFIIGSLISCRSSDTKTQKKHPVLSPRASIKAMQVAEGFEVKIVASEPLISNPVAMAFDDSLSLWVVEMNGFDPIRDDQTNAGKVVILSDKNGDGRMDVSQVFIDSLNAPPRAICIVEGGILLAVPPNLWYVENDHGHAGRKVLVDSVYTVSQNIEGQTNGLLRALDNWIYSAGFGSTKRYRRINGEWITQGTHERGQWGISQDNYGRLFYNNNSTNLLGDYFLPGFGAENPNQEYVNGYNEVIVSDNRVYPIHPTPGVNRGYRPGVLDDSLRLIHFTAASGPVIYRGGTFGEAYAGNAFVAAPATNLIKRNILKEKGYKITGKQAYTGKEFLASTDTRFRPVTLYNGPDGALYVVDMYRGLIEAINLTDYLKEYSLSHNLIKPKDYGRIYKVVPKGKKNEMIRIPNDPGKLVKLLKSPNGWVRDHAQHQLIDKEYTQAIPALRDLFQQAEKYSLAAIHALWTLEGLNAVTPKDITALLKGSNNHVKMESVAVMATVIDQRSYKTYLPIIKQLIAAEDSLVAPYTAYAIDKLHTYAPNIANRLLSNFIPLYINNKYVMDAVIAGLSGRERKYIAKFPDSTTYFHQQLADILEKKATVDKKEEQKRESMLKRKYPKGFTTYNATCQTCHGANGNGIKYVAPPLNGSKWVTGNKYRTIAIVLYGLTGSIKVGGEMYKKGEITGYMPAYSDNFSAEKIAQIVSFIRKNWSNRASEVQASDVERVRQRFSERQKPFTPDELIRLFKDQK